MTARDDQFELLLGGLAPGPSDEQLAVLAFERDLVVTAGAGSGKTRTLVDLYAGVLDDPRKIGREELRPSEILCLTFTERAAREILRRIRDTVEDPALLRELESAPIGTFHGWCAGVLRDHPLEAGIDPRFNVLSEDAAADLLLGAALETLRSGLETGDEPARIAVGLLGFHRAAVKLTELVRETRTAGWTEREPIARFEARLAAVAGELEPLARDVDRAAEEVTDAVRGSLTTPLARRYLEDLDAARARWRYDRSPEAAELLTHAAKAPARSWRGVTELRTAVVDAIEAWRQARREIDNAQQLGVWPALTVSVRAAYRAARFARASLDYDDLLLRARDLLVGHAEILEAVRARHRVILVDEHQDTDPVQHQILELLLGDALGGRGAGPRWCVVGDVRQSIYGFRGATVEAFAGLARDAEARGAHRTLAYNYRSRVELIDFHNAFFPRLLTAGPHAETLAYVAQRAWREKESAGPAVELLAPGEDGVPAADAREMEAKALAARIRAACDAGDPGAVRVWDKQTKQWRTAAHGDVVILMRKLTQVEPYRRALQAVGIETVVTGSGEFYGRQEVFDVLNAIEAALAPQDPIPLVAFLRSPMVGMADDAIWRLARGWGRKEPLGPHLTARAAAGAVEPDQAERLAFGEAVLEELRARADAEPPGAIAAWLVDRTGYAAVLDAVPDRDQRRANLERLIALADRAPSEGAGLLADWAAALRRRAEHPPRDRDASPPEAGDRVLILSIHQAKGLEFPVVVLADVGGAAQSGRGPGVTFDRELGVVAKWWEDPASPSLQTRSYALASAAGKERERAEETRLLYVAATRARDRLIFSAGARANEGWWLPALLEFAQAQGGSHLDLDSLDRWLARHPASASSTAVPDPGRAYLDPLDSAPGEATAREVAAAVTGEAEEVIPAVARDSMRLRMRRGKRAHAALERLPLRPPPGFDLRSWLSGAGVDDADRESLAAFVERELWPRLSPATEVRREQPFRLRLPEPGGTVVGTIDCLWRDAVGSWWVWDYKLVSDDASEARHEAQLSIYALAAAASLGVDEVRGALWYLGTGLQHELRWHRDALIEAEQRLARAFPRGAATFVDEVEDE